MNFIGEYHIPAPRDLVWISLNDAEILKVCIDGCESLEWTGDNTLKAKVRAKIGPVSASFSGLLTLTEVDPGNSYVLRGQGDGGAMGLAKGEARVVLSDAPDTGGTIMRYEASASLGGERTAALGARLVSGVVERTAEGFFDRLAQRLEVAALAALTVRDAKAADEELFVARPVNLETEFPEGIAAPVKATAGSRTFKALWITLGGALAAGIAAWLLYTYSIT